MTRSFVRACWCPGTLILFITAAAPLAAQQPVERPLAPLALATGEISAPTRQGVVTGRVIDGTTQQPLVGASVTVEGTGLGTLTREDGTFTLSEVPAGTHTLRASLIGYGAQEQEVTVVSGETATVSFQLQPEAVVLEGLVAVGYSDRSERELVSSVTQVGDEELDGVTAADVTSALQGKAAGVQITSPSGMPGDAPQVRIRGTGSITASAEPLYVVDGVISDASIARFIPPQDVQSVTVLKDAAATSLYGSRAANGVIVITTRSGRPGDTQVRFSSSLGYADPVFGNFELMNSRQLYEYSRLMDAPNLTEDVLQHDTDWLGIAFDRGMVRELNASASGGSDRTRFYVSGGYYDEEGTMMATGFDRFSARVNLEHEATERLDITARVYGTYEHRERAGSGIDYYAYTMIPWDVPYNEDGTMRTGLEADWRGRDSHNFLFPLQYNTANGQYQDFSGDLVLSYELTDWLDFSTSNRAKLEFDHWRAYTDMRTPAGDKNGGELNNSKAWSTLFLTSNLLTADKQFGDHGLGALVGAEYSRSYFDNVGGTGIGIFPGMDILDVTASPLTLGGERRENRFASAFFQGNYSFLDRYFATFSFRRDGSSRFGADNRYGNFYSVGGAWMISDEAFLRNATALDLLKLRASYGTTGNAEIGNYVSQGIYTYSAAYDGIPGSRPARIPNPDLTWEVARSLNVGLDAGFFDRVDVSLDLYRRVNSDLLQNVELAKTSGFSSRIMNIGEVENRGVELQVSTLNLSGPVTWTTDFNLAVNRNEVLSLHNGEDVLNGRQRIMEGHDILTWYMREWAGVDPETGAPQWEKLIYDESGNVTGMELTSDYNDATQQIVGTASPDFTGGMRNGFDFGDVSLSAFVDFVYGPQIYHSAREYFDSDGAYPTFNNMLLPDDWSRWSAPGDVATHPKPVFGGNQNSNKTSSRYLEDGSYLRLRNITASYMLPESLLGGIGIGSARVYLSADNLYTLTEFSGADPESAIGGTIHTRYPVSRKLLVGLDVGL